MFSSLKKAQTSTVLVSLPVPELLDHRNRECLSKDTIGVALLGVEDLVFLLFRPLMGQNYCWLLSFLSFICVYYTHPEVFK